MSIIKESNFSGRMFHRAAISICLFATAGFGILADETVFQDSFTGKANGKALNGSALEKGEASWNAPESYVFAGDEKDGWIKCVKSGGSAADMPLPPGASLIQIDLDCRPAAQKGGWIAVGASSSRGSTTWSGGLFLYLDAAGHAQVLADGTRLKITSKKIENFKPDGLNSLSLKYDRTTNSVSASVNKTVLLSDYSLTQKGYTPKILYAGFSSYGVSQESKIDNFSLKVQSDKSAAVIPEGREQEKIKEASPTGQLTKPKTGVAVPSEETAFHDSFTGKSSGKALNGSALEKGGVSWNAPESYVFAGDEKDGWIKCGKPEGSSAKVALNPGVSLIQIDMECRPAAKDKGWIAVGFNGSPSRSEPTWPGGLFLYLDTAGHAQVLADGTRLKITSKKIEDFNKDGMNSLSLKYDRTANSISATVNKTVLLNDFGLTQKGYVPKTMYAGFSSYGVSQDSRIDNFSLKVQSDKNAAAIQTEQEKVKDANTYLILFIGDSITRSAPNETHKWKIHCGMAASSESNDYAHLLTSKISGSLPGKKAEPVFLASGGGVVRNYVGRTGEYKNAKPDLVIVQFGENERQERTIEAFNAEYENLLKDVTGLSPAPKVICVGIWNPGDGGTYTPWALMVDDSIERLAAKHGASYVPVRDLARNPECRGYGETNGVKWHPNDKGMKGYSEKIFEEWKKISEKK